jgi:L-arabinose isomerase
MTNLGKTINLFGDDDIIKFLRLEKEVPHLLSNLRDQYEMNRLGKKIEETDVKTPQSACSIGKRKNLDHKNIMVLMGDISNMTGNLLNRNRGKSDDVGLLPSETAIKIAK